MDVKKKIVKKTLKKGKAIIDNKLEIKVENQVTNLNLDQKMNVKKDN